MLKTGVIAASIVLALSTGAAQAQDCSNAMDQASMNRCAYDDWQAADRELNRLWKRAMAMARSMDQYTPPGEITTSDALRRAQRTWIKFRDQACEAEGLLMRGGTAQSMLISGCKARLTRARSQDLRIFADMY